MNAGILNDICQESDIQFILICKGKVIYKSDKYLELDSNICSKFTIGTNEYEIKIFKQDKRALALLIHCVKNALLEINYKKDKIILEVLDGKDIAKKELIRIYPFMVKSFSIIVIYSEDNLEKVFELIEEGYRNIDAIRVLFENKIIILGDLDNAREHAQSIRESLAYDFYGKCIISYAMIKDPSAINEVYEMCNRKIQVALRLNINQDVLGEKDLLFEEAIESISIEDRKKIIKNFKTGFNRIDSQMFKTIDTFFKCSLNLSEASKELYIHRNTLIYRLDKLFKETGFDLRNFNDAVVFKIMVLIWKQFKN